MRNIILSILFICVFFSCSKEKLKGISLLGFSIGIPDEWKRIKMKGIDSETYGLSTAQGDTVFIDYGKFSNEFNETIKVFSFTQIKKYDSLKMNTKDLKVSLTPHIDQNQAVFHKEYYYYLNFEDIQGKVRVPKQIGKGITGISFRNINGSENHLTIYGKNLRLKEQNQLLESFKTIKFTR